METAVVFNSSSLQLRGFLNEKESKELFIILHPYGPLGGDCDNPVVYQLATILSQKGYSTLRFDMRGAGSSHGRTSWNGQPECNDLVEICKDPRFIEKDVILIGYSYGSVIACFAALEINNVKTVISIAYPTSVLWAITTFNQRLYLDGLGKLSSDLNKFFIIGSRDNFSSIEQWNSMLDAAGITESDRMVIDSDHFFNSPNELRTLIEAPIILEADNAAQTHVDLYYRSTQTNFASIKISVQMPPINEKYKKTFGLGSEAPNFIAQTTLGEIDFHKWKGNAWTILFSFPGAFTPVCTTDIGAMSELQPTWDVKGVKVIGLSCSPQSKHEEWICDVNQIMQCNVAFPIISDTSREISQLYNMLDFQEVTNVDDDGNPFTHRSVFVIDPSNVIRAQITYPLSTGRNFDEILRVVDSLILYDTQKLATGSKWKPGSPAYLLNSRSDEEAKKVSFQY